LNTGYLSSGPHEEVGWVVSSRAGRREGRRRSRLPLSRAPTSVLLTVEDAPEHVARDGRAQDVARELERGLAVVDARRALEDLIWFLLGFPSLRVFFGAGGGQAGGGGRQFFSVCLFSKRRSACAGQTPYHQHRPPDTTSPPTEGRCSLWFCAFCVSFLYQSKKTPHLHDGAAAVDLEHLAAAVGAVAEAHLDDLGKLGPVAVSGSSRGGGGGGGGGFGGAGGGGGGGGGGVVSSSSAAAA